MIRRSFLTGTVSGLLLGAAERSAAAGSGSGRAEVGTAQGRLKGQVENGIARFLGIPFAAAPDGPLRLHPPRPPEPWNGLREAFDYGPKPPQTAYPPMVAELLPEYKGTGDNCLTLNVWTPDTGAADLPVLVWIAGGMFEYHATGTSPLYDGTAFARDGVVCVTTSYRVGAEGFLYLDDGIANLGLLDQIAALEWVRDNIAAFGGDPGNVTVFGESAGALSIATLMSMPRAAGLFRRSIVQSGGAHLATSPETALRIGRRLAEKIGVAPTRAAIAAAPRDALLQAQLQMRIEMQTAPDPAFWGEVMLTSLPWAPVVDGEVVPGLPIDRIRAGLGHDVDLIAGSNTEETRLFMVTEGSIPAVPPEALAGLVAAYGLPVDPTLAAYRELHPGASSGDLMSALTTDWYWRIPALRLAEAHLATARSGRTFMYEFAWRSPRFGAGHSLEVPFVFESFGAHTVPMLGADPPRALADRMHAAWVGFARDGDPGWPRFDAERGATMRFDANPAVVAAPLRRESALWAAVR